MVASYIFVIVYAGVVVSVRLFNYYVWFRWYTFDDCFVLCFPVTLLLLIISTLTLL